MSTAVTSFRLPSRLLALLPLIWALMLLMLSACSSGVQVRSDSSPSADFTQFKTYGFFQPMGIEAGYSSPVFGETFRVALITVRGWV